MKRTLALLASALFVNAGWGQVAAWSKMNPYMQMTLNKFCKETSAKRAIAIGEAATLPPTALLLQVTDGVNVDSLMSRYAAKRLAHHDNLMIIAISPDSIAPLSLSNGVERMEMTPRGELQNDKSRLASGVDMVHSASGKLPQAFTGKGVVAGIVDVGFDFGHITFRDKNGRSRIRKFWDLGKVSEKPDNEKSEWECWGTIYNTTEEVDSAKHTSDAEYNTHGTHVLGTMAGRGDIEGKWRGMAPDADIIGAMSTLGAIPFEYTGDDETLKAIYETANFDVLAMDFIFAQANAENKPCVINYSLTYSEAHCWLYPGLLMEEYIRKLTGPGKIFVCSAGNGGGNSHLYAEKQYQKPMRLRLSHGTSNPLFFFRLNDIYNIPTFKISYLADTLTVNLSEIGELYEHKLNYPNTSDSLTVYIEPNRFVNKGDSCLSFAFMLEMDDIIKGIQNKDFAASQLHVSFEDGGSGSFMTSMNSSVYIKSQDEGDESVLFEPGSRNLGCPATFDCSITVGATQRTDLSGNSDDYNDMKNGQIATFSSKGPTWDGRTKPDIAAPGCYVVSAKCRYTKDSEKMYDTTEVDGETYGWYTNMGTSMASPCVAGIIALWLEADPTLSPEDIKNVFAKTATHIDDTLDYPNNSYGYGEINAYAGLLEILGLNASIPSISSSQPRDVQFNVDGKNIVITIDGHDNSAYKVIVYSTDGKTVKSLQSTSPNITLDMSEVPSGVYAVQLKTSNRYSTGSTLVRL